MKVVSMFFLRKCKNFLKHMIFFSQHEQSFNKLSKENGLIPTIPGWNTRLQSGVKLFLPSRWL